MIKIVLTEDHNVVRYGIKSLLEKETDIEVVADVQTGQELLDLLSTGIEADVLVIAANVPFLNGIDLFKQIGKSYPGFKIVMLSLLDDEQHIVEAFKAGVVGYMVKTISATEFIFGVKYIANTSERYLCNQLSLRMLDKLINSFSGVALDGNAVEVSKREVEILSLISHGFTNQEVADKLFTSKRTIESHRQNLIEKTGTRNTAALVRYAVLNKLIN